jgi:DNA-binding response OmpR family regulator
MPQTYGFVSSAERPTGSINANHKSLEDIQGFFQHEKITLLTASDGIRALEIFQAENPDLVLTAALLPKLNGFDLCKKITGGEVGEVRPVIMFSEIYRAEKYRKEAIIGCGAVDFLEKPLVKAQLLKAIEHLFSEIPSGKAVRQTQITFANKPAEIHSSMRQVGFSQAEDLLELNRLLETVSPSNSEINFAQEEPALLETSIPEPGVCSVDADRGDEIEAAVDAIRIDLDVGTRVQVQKAAQGIGAKFHVPKDNQDILEFEAIQDRGVENLQIQPIEAVEIVELEVPLANPAIEPTFDLDKGGAPNIMANLKKDQADMIAPPTALRHQEPRNWIPIIALILLALLVLFFYCLGAR